MAIPFLVFENKRALGEAAADQAAAAIRSAIGARGSARILAGTGASQFELLEALANRRDVDW